MRGPDLAFALGEYAVGAASAAGTAAAIHAVVSPGWDVVLAMLAGMLLGSLVHVVSGVLFAPLVGMFQVMSWSTLVGMYGGMLFGMRDAMQPAGWSQVLLVGALFGICAVAAVQTYDRMLRGPRAGAVE